MPSRDAPRPRRSPPTLDGRPPAAPAGRLPEPVGRVLRSPGPGDPLAASVAAPLTRSLGVDVSPVRVHAGGPSAAAAAELSARAFTWGRDVHLGAGERPTDLPLLAHEVAHVVQQQAGADPALRLFTSASADPYEREAEAVAAASVRGEPAAVSGRTGGPRIQRQLGWLRRGIAAVGRGVSAVAGAVAEGAAGIRDRVLGFIRDKAHLIPGYGLLSFVLGRDPITQQPVERTATNLIRALVGLIPGGAAILANLERSGVVQRAGDWFGAEVSKLGLSWDMIRGLFARAWDALSVTDLLNPSGAWEKIKAIFGPPVRRLVDFAIACGRKLLEFVFEGALALAGGAGQRILGIFRRIGAAFSLIVADPVGFLANLIRAVKGGFQKFVANIWTHLRTALFRWLTGALGPIRLPARWDLMGIVSVIVQILGLTYDRMRGKLVRLIGEPAVRAIETAFEFLKTIVTGGLAAAWQKLLEFASGLVDTVIGGIRDWVAKSVVGAAVTKLVTMFNPVGAIIQGIITIYNTVMFFIERAQQIAALVESIVDSISSIARGSVGAAIDHVERTLARTLPVIISFLARLIGLGNISGTVRGIIERIQSTVSNAIDKVVGFVVDRAKAIIARLTGRAGRPASAEGGRSGAVKQIARARLVERLPRAANRGQGEAIVAQVRNELRPQGLQRLEITGERPDGSLVIAAAASAFDELMTYLFRPDAHSTQGKIYTRMATRITLAGAQAPFPQWPAVPGTTSPVTRPGQPGGAYAAAIAVEEERYGRPRSQPTFGGALFRPDPAVAGASTREVFAATYNTSDEAKACNNRTHAETQFRRWLTQQPTTFRDRVSAIDMVITYSPCTNCVRTLVGIGTLIPASAKLSLQYTNVYPRTACRTTAASLDELRSAGWTVNGPAPAQ